MPVRSIQSRSPATSSTLRLIREVVAEKLAGLGHQRGRSASCPNGVNGASTPWKAPKEPRTRRSASIAALGQREERRDRAGLHERKLPVAPGPFDVLGAPKAACDLPRPARPVRRSPRRAAPGPPGWPRSPLDPSHFSDDAAGSPVVDDVVVRLDLPADERFAQAERRVDHGFPAPAGQRVGGEEDARRIRCRHLLHDDGQGDMSVWRCRCARGSRSPGRSTDCSSSPTTARSRASSPATFRKVSCCPAKERSGKSSAVAEERTATAPAAPKAAT